MKEYLLFCIFAICLTILFDHIAGTRLYKNTRFWRYQLIIFVLTVIVDGFISGKGVVLYNPEYVLPYRILYTPVENFLFGFSMIYLNIIVFEKLKR